MAGTDTFQVVVVNAAQDSGEKAANFYMDVSVPLVGVELTFLLHASPLSQELHISFTSQLRKQELKKALLL